MNTAMKIAGALLASLVSLAAWAQGVTPKSAMAAI